MFFCFSPLNLQKHAFSIRAALKSEGKIKVELRLINRHVYASIIERSAMGDGYVFELDSTKTKITCLEDKKMILCTTYYPNIGWFYGEKIDYKRKVIILPPLHPYLTEEKLNELRRFLFLSDLNLKYSSLGYIQLSKEQYCNY